MRPIETARYSFYLRGTDGFQSQIYTRYLTRPDSGARSYGVRERQTSAKRRKRSVLSPTAKASRSNFRRAPDPDKTLERYKESTLRTFLILRQRLGSPA